VRQISLIPSIAGALALAWMTLIFYLSGLHQRPGPAAIPMPQAPLVPGAPPASSIDLVDVAGHFGLYAVLAALLWLALGVLHVSAVGRSILALFGAVAYAISDEWHQSFVTGRQPSGFDLVVDTAGAVAGLVVVVAAWWLWGRVGRGRWA
jgi:VanZ family protein